MLPIERALVSSYRPSIVSFPLSLRVSEIFPLLCSSTPLFHTPPPVSPNFSVLPWEQVDGVWATKCEGVELIFREISFQYLQSMWYRSTNVADGLQTGGRTTCHRKTAVCSVVHHGVKTKVLGYDKPTTPIYSPLGLETQSSTYAARLGWSMILSFVYSINQLRNYQ